MAKQSKNKLRKAVENVERISSDTTPIRKFEDLRKLQKRANQRMLRLEREGINSPAYEAVQAKLEILGRRTGDNIGRRFSETGMAKYNEYEYQKKVLEDFLGAKTSTVKGAKNWIDTSYGTSNDMFGLADVGITKEDWGEFWKNAPQKVKDRMLGSDQVIEQVRAFQNKRNENKKLIERGKYKNGRKISAARMKELKDEQKMTFVDIADEIYASKDIKEAQKRLGVTYKDLEKVASLGKLRNPFDNSLVEKVLK